MMMRAAMPPGGGEAPRLTTVAGDPRHAQRRAVLETRKERLVRKASELATLCAVPVALSCPAIDDGCEPLRWPSKEEAREINKRYKALPENDRRKHSVGDAAYLANQAAKQQGPGGELARASEGDQPIAAAFGAMPDEELRELLRSIDGSLAAASDMIQKAAHEAEQKLSLERARADTLMVDSQDAVPPNAAPMDMGDNPVASEDAVLECPQQLMKLSRSLEKLPDPFRSFEEEPEPVCFKKKPKPCTTPPPPPPASGNGVPYDGKHINLGGYMIERDRFDAIWREHAIPPQSLQPKSLPHDGGEPLQLWSFDDGETRWKRPLRGEDQSSLDTCVDGILDRLKGLRSVLSLR